MDVELFMVSLIEGAVATGLGAIAGWLVRGEYDRHKVG